MVARLINILLTRTAIGKWLNGRKTLISTGLLVLAAVLELLKQLAAIFPQYAPLSLGAEHVSTFLSAAVETLAAIGFGGLTVGVAHKAAKAKLAKDAKE